MNAGTIREVVAGTKPPLNFYTSDGRVVYVDHPETVLISEQVIAIGTGGNGGKKPGVLQQITFLSPDHIMRIEPTKRRPLRRVI